MYDSKCYELAQHFLPKADEKVWDMFANDIQWHVEQWCSFDPRSPEYEGEADDHVCIGRPPF